MKTIVALLLTSSIILRAELPDSVTTPNIQFQAVRANEAISVDGSLSESVWKQAEGVSRFTQRDPVEGGMPSENTIVRVAYDEAAIYIGAEMVESAPDSMVVRLSRRDANWDSDMFIFYVDPYHDKRTGYYFGLDAAGTFYDGTLYNDDWTDDSWDGVWEGKVARSEKGWTAEMRIPFSQLRFQESDQYVWGVNFRRQIARKNERDFIVFTPKNGSGFVSRFVDLRGIDNISPARQVEVLPYITTKAEYLNHATGDPFNDGSRYTQRLGADMKIGLGSNLTLDATVNPDFGQVEVDPAVVNLSDVETIFQEKRPFFIEGASIFWFGQGGANNNWNFNWPGVDFLYSRRIGRSPQGGTPNADFIDRPLETDILGAAKLTGKVGDKWSIGTIQAVTSREYAELETAGQRSRVEVEPLSYYGLGRAMKEFNDGRQALGFITTYAHRMFDEPELQDEINKNAVVGGVDGWTFLDPDKVWVISGWAAATTVSGSRARITSLQQHSRHYFQRPDADHLEVDTNATSLNGFAARVKMNKQKGNFYTNASFGFINPGFDPNDLGFSSRADIINGHLVMSYRWSEPGSFYRFIELGGSAFENLDFGKNVTWQGLFHFGFIEFPNFYSIDWNTAYNPRTVNTRRTRGGPLTENPPGVQYNISGQTDGTKSVVLNAGWFTYQADYQRQWSAWLGVNWRPAPNVSMSISPELSKSLEMSQWVGVYDDPLATNTFGRRYVFAEMNQTTLSAGVRLNWTFTPKLSLQMYVQPLISAGDFANYKELARPGSYEFNRYGDNGSTFDEETYIADPDGGTGPAPEITLYNPDFSFKSIRGNAVLRWEYLPGSTLYFVWTQSRNDFEDVGDFQFRNAMSRLMDATPDNIFMIKMNYWWNL